MPPGYVLSLEYLTLWQEYLTCSCACITRCICPVWNACTQTNLLISSKKN